MTISQHLGREIEALDLVALAANEVKTRGTPKHALAVECQKLAVEEWKAKFDPQKCPHCGKPLKRKFN